MEVTVRRMLEMLQEAGDGIIRGWDALAQAQPIVPLLTPWLLALLILVWMAALRSRRPQPLSIQGPQLLITQGEVVPELANTTTITPRKRTRGIEPAQVRAGSLTMTISNLSRYPVQVLEVAVRHDARGTPCVARCERMVPALGAAEVEARLPLDLEGDGWLDVYVYAAAPRHKLHRHRAELVWEPWVSRFKVAPMDQTLAPARQLASEERNAVTEMPVAAPAPLPDVDDAPTPEPGTDVPLDTPMVDASNDALEAPAAADTEPVQEEAELRDESAPRDDAAPSVEPAPSGKRGLLFPDDF